MKASVEGRLIDFVNNSVGRIMNTFDDIRKYGKGHYRQGQEA